MGRRRQLVRERVDQHHRGNRERRAKNTTCPTGVKLSPEDGNGDRRLYVKSLPPARRPRSEKM